MSLNGIVQRASTGLHGFDANTPISKQIAAAFRQQGFRFCVRYLSRSTPQAATDLSLQEAEGILAGGLSVMAVQHVSRASWVPDTNLGHQYGEAAATNAKAAGLPGGVVVWLDLEGVKSGVPAGDVLGYCNAWFQPVAAAGYEPGIYVGAGCVLSGHDLYWRLRTKHYWRSGSDVPDIPMRGYQLVQRITSSPDMVNGIAIDRDVTLTDSFGDTVVWLSPTETSGDVNSVS